MKLSACRKSQAGTIGAVARRSSERSSLCPMTSWRDGATQQAQDDLDGMLGATIPFAQEMLAKNGEFYPYGASLSIDGEVKMEASYTGDEQPESQALLDLLIAGLRDKRD